MATVRDQTPATTAAQALLRAGMAVSFLPLAMAQIAHETGGFKSAVFAENNNLSGIMYINNPAVQKDSTAGRAFPGSESSTARYAHFSSVNAWAKDYIRILSMGARPIDATSAEDFAHRLKLNGYYAAYESDYTKALRSWMGTYDEAIETAKATTPGTAMRITSFILALMLCGIGIFLAYKYRP